MSVLCFNDFDLMNGRKVIIGGMYMAASGDKSYQLSLPDQTLVLEALDMYAKSCERVAKAARNPQVSECHRLRAADTRILSAKVAK